MEGRKLETARLFGPATIAAHAFFLPVLGAGLAAINHRSLGNANAFWRTILVFGVPSAFVLVCQVATSRAAPPGSPGHGLARLLAFFWAIAIAQLLYWEHEPIVKRHIEAGGRKAPWYLATLSGLAVVLVLGIVVAALRLETLE
jgi:hypothetical protein